MQSAVTKESVRNFHNQQQVNSNNNHNLTQIVNILGGIDSILSDYLSETSNISIDTIKLTKIQQLLETPLKYQSHNKSQPLTKLNKTNPSPEDHANNNIYYEFDDNDTYLHSVFGEATSGKLLQLAHNNIIRVIILLFVLLTLIIHFVRMQHVILKIIQGLVIIQGLLFITVLTPYAIIMLLSINKKGFKLTLLTFEFWYKLLNSIVAGVCSVWIDLLDDAHPYPWGPTAQIASFILLTLTVLYISCFDAYHLNTKWKIIFALFFGILFFIGTILWQINAYYNYNAETMHWINVWFLRYSLESLRVHSWRVLTIFFWKQAIVSIMRYKNDKCISIKCTPSIKWNQATDSALPTITLSNNDDLKDNDCNEMKIEVEPTAFQSIKYCDDEDESSDSSIF